MPINRQPVASALGEGAAQRAVGLSEIGFAHELWDRNTALGNLSEPLH
jgi:hypothetical protein